MRPPSHGCSYNTGQLPGVLGRGIYAASASHWQPTLKEAFHDSQTVVTTIIDATRNTQHAQSFQSCHCAISGRRRVTPGFTLIELLVVIAILAILAAILLPVYSAANERAYRTGCVNNFKELGTAIQLFADEHGDQLPGPTWQGLYENYDNQDISRLPFYLNTYLAEPPPSPTPQTAILMRCPSAARHWTAASTDTAPMDLARPLSYIANNQVTNISGGILTWPFGYPYTLIGGASDQAPLKMSQIASPANSWAMTDADQQNAASSGGYYDFLPANPTHGTVRNQLFFDWHVEAIRAVNENMPNPQL